MSEKAKLRWHCRRGMKELDNLLVRYLEQHYDAASEAEQAAFVELLALQDPQLLDYLFGRATPQDAALKDVLRKLSATQH
jgi:antitoxin CptB